MALMIKTIALASLSLASKSTECPRRMREIIFPAHGLLRQSQGALASTSMNLPLQVPSALYDTLRQTLVQAELILLRILGFELRLPLPLDYLPRYLERAMKSVSEEGEDYDSWSNDEKEEYGVVRAVMDTGVGKACRAKAVEACAVLRIQLGDD